MRFKYMTKAQTSIYSEFLPSVLLWKDGKEIPDASFLTPAADDALTPKALEESLVSTTGWYIPGPQFDLGVGATWCAIGRGIFLAW